SPKSINIFLCPYLLLAAISPRMTAQVIPKYVSNSHVPINSQISSGPNLGLLLLADSTTVTAPATATNTPSPSRFLKGSFSIIGAIMQFDMRATTPRGETTDAGANP